MEENLSTFGTMTSFGGTIIIQKITRMITNTEQLAWQPARLRGQNFYNFRENKNLQYLMIWDKLYLFNTFKTTNKYHPCFPSEKESTVLLGVEKKVKTTCEENMASHLC